VAAEGIAESGGNLSLLLARFRQRASSRSLFRHLSPISGWGTRLHRVPQTVFRGRGVLAAACSGQRGSAGRRCTVPRRAPSFSRSA